MRVGLSVPCEGATVVSISHQHHCCHHPGVVPPSAGRSVVAQRNSISRPCVAALYQSTL